MKRLVFFALLASVSIYSCQSSNTATEELSKSIVNNTKSTTLEPTSVDKLDQEGFSSLINTMHDESNKAIVDNNTSNKTNTIKSNTTTEGKTLSADMKKLVAANESFTKFFNKTDQTVQSYVFDAQTAKSIVCKQGTKIAIPANSFIDSDGNPVQGKVTLKVKEYYKMSDIILANLTTLSNGKQLETGGMLHLDAFDESNKQCQLSKDKSLEVQMPTKVIKPDMELFVGTRTQDSTMNWNLAGPNKNPRKKIYGPHEVQQRAIFEKLTSDKPLQLGQFKDKNFKHAKTGLLFACVITNEGDIINPKILIGTRWAFDGDLKKFAKSLPKPQPALVDGEPVCSYFIMPILIDSVSQGLYCMNNYTNPKESKINYNKYVGYPEYINAPYYVFAINRLGWINCDRFINTPQENLIDNYVVNLENVDPEKSRIYMYFEQYQSLLPATFSNGQWRYSKVPKNAKVNILVTSIQDEIYKIVKKTVLLEEKGITLALQELPEENFKNTLATIEDFSF